MSHNVTISGVKIHNLDALKQAVSELNAEQSLGIEIVPNGSMRGWNGRTEKAELVLRFPGCRYDIGFNRDKEGAYVPRFEDMAGSDFGQHIGVTPGAQTIEGQALGFNRDPQSAIGRLVQRTNVITAEHEAARNGHTTTREVDTKTGIINVIAEMR